MKNFFSKTTLVLASMVLSASAYAVDIGQAAPDFELPNPAGASVKLSSYKGKVVYLDFWASWCGPCKQSFPWMNEMQSRYGAKNFQIVGVNVDQKSDDAKEFLKENKATFDVVFDNTGKIPKTFAIKGMPTSMLIGADGKVISVHTGFKPENKAELEKQIKDALGVK